MNAPHEHAAITPAGDALQDYVDALLLDSGIGSGTASTPTASGDAADSPGGRRYRVCQIGPVRLALPQDALLEPVPLPPLLAYSGPDWYLGRHRHAGTEWHVIDLAFIVAPGVPHPLPDALLPLVQGHCALACTLEPEPLLLDNDAIRWRQGGSARPWLAGITEDHRCAVVDLQALIDGLGDDPRLRAES